LAFIRVDCLNSEFFTDDEIKNNYCVFSVLRTNCRRR
jgi:hypothetical protein